MHQRELATAAWLRTGLGQTSAIPRGHLVASCDRVLQLRPEVRKALAFQLSKVTEDRLEEFNLLMLDSRSVQKLTDETFNDETVISDQNAEQLLDLIRSAVAEETREEFERKMEAQRDSAESTLHDVHSKLEGIEDALKSAEDEIQNAKLREGIQVYATVTRLNRSAQAVDTVMLCVMLLLCAGAVLNALTGIMSGLGFWSAILLAASAFSLYNIVCNAMGYEKISFRYVVHKILARKLERALDEIHITSYREPEYYKFEHGRIKMANELNELERSLAADRREPRL